MANNLPVEYGTTPVGRIVMCPREGLFAKGTTDQNNRPIVPEKQRFFVGLAIEKSAPGVNEFLATLHKAASGGYAASPHIMQQVNAGLAATAFSWKVQDGDEQVTDPETGVVGNRTPHALGCYIFKFGTTLPMKAAKFEPGSNVPTFCDESELFKGCYAQISYSCSANGNLDITAGVFLNPKTICLMTHIHGEPIVGGPDLATQFQGGPGTYTPAGASTAPVAPMGQPPMGQPHGAPDTQAYGAPLADPNAPMNAGGGMPAPNTNAGATGSHGGMPQPNAQPAATPPGYGGYMGGNG